MHWRFFESRRGRWRRTSAIASIVFAVQGWPVLADEETASPSLESRERVERGQGVYYLLASDEVESVAFFWNGREFPFREGMDWGSRQVEDANWEHGFASLRWLRGLFLYARTNESARAELLRILMDFHQHHTAGGDPLQFYFGDHTWAIRLTFLVDTHLMLQDVGETPPAWLIDMITQHALGAYIPGRVFKPDAFNCKTNLHRAQV